MPKYSNEKQDASPLPYTTSLFPNKLIIQAQAICYSLPMDGYNDFMNFVHISTGSVYPHMLHVCILSFRYSYIGKMTAKLLRLALILHVFDQAVEISSHHTAITRNLSQQDVSEGWNEYLSTQNETPNPYLDLLHDPKPLHIDPTMADFEKAVEDKWITEISVDTINQAFTLAGYFIDVYECFLPPALDPTLLDMNTPPQEIVSDAGTPDDLLGDLENKWPSKIARLYFTASKKPFPISHITQAKLMPPCQTLDNHRYLSVHARLFASKLAELGYIQLQDEVTNGRRKTVVRAVPWHSLMATQCILLETFQENPVTNR